MGDSARGHPFPRVTVSRRTEHKDDAAQSTFSANFDGSELVLHVPSEMLRPQDILTLTVDVGWTFKAQCFILVQREQGADRPFSFGMLPGLALDGVSSIASTVTNVARASVTGLAALGRVFSSSAAAEDAVAASADAWSEETCVKLVQQGQIVDVTKIVGTML